MDRNLWTQTITANLCPQWNCPVCDKGAITMVRNSLVLHEDQISVEMRREMREEWEPEWITYKFVAWARCRSESCGQYFAMSGTGGMGPEQTTRGEYEWVDYFALRRIDPMPDICRLPKKCPNSVKNALRSSFSLFYEHPASCAGRIRVALECLMNHVGVQKKAKNKKGKFTTLKLHDRILKFSKGDPVNGAHLMALKWVGNTGSHDSEIKKSDLLDAFEIIEHTLSEIIDRRSDRVTKLSKKLTKRHK